MTITTYSKKIQGEPGNYGWAVRFDKTGGFVGINQYEKDDLKDRILLSPKQVKKLISFAGTKAKRVLTSANPQSPSR